MLTNGNEGLILYVYSKENGGGIMSLNLKKIKEERIERGITQEAMAEKLGWKTRTPYAKRENGFVDIGADELQKIGEALGYNKDQLGIFFTFNVPEKERTQKREGNTSESRRNIESAIARAKAAKKNSSNNCE